MHSRVLLVLDPRRYVSGSLKTLFKGVKSNDEMDDEGIDEAVSLASRGFTLPHHS